MNQIGQLRFNYGAPLSRRRIFLVLIRAGVLCENLRSKGLDALAEFLKSKLVAMQMPVVTDWLIGSNLYSYTLEYVAMCFNLLIIVEACWGTYYTCFSATWFTFVHWACHGFCLDLSCISWHLEAQPATFWIPSVCGGWQRTPNVQQKAQCFKDPSPCFVQVCVCVCMCWF